MTVSHLKGFATPQGTTAYKNRFENKLDQSFFRQRNQLWFSSVGIGSYLGEPDSETDKAYKDAFKEAVLSGVNVIDSAINYRAQRSERSFGMAIAELVKAGDVKREELILCTKAGFIPFDGEYPADTKAYFKQTYLDPDILQAEDIAQGCHAMTPAYLEDQLARSLENWGVETIDIFYLHNPETQLNDVDRVTFRSRLKDAFVWCEEKVKEGKIKCYGTATWNGYRVGFDAPDYLSLEETALLAREAGGVSHHFKVVQLPVNLAMLEAWGIANQKYGAQEVPLLGMVDRLGITVIGSASLLQSRLAGQLPESFTSHFPNLKTSAQCALQFVRSLPGITTSLVGMKNIDHVRENLEVGKSPFLSESELFALFQKSES